MIDGLGNAYGAGKVSLEADPGGLFPSAGSDLVRITVERNAYVTLSPAVARRDATTGYLVGDSDRLRIVLPGAVSVILERALRSPPGSCPVTFAIDDEGRISTGDSATGAEQGLSDWRGLVVGTADEGLHVTVSAALQSRPHRYRPADRRDFWPTVDGVPPRIDIDFTLDVLTRVVCYGGYSKELPAAIASGPAPVLHTTRDSMRLESTSVGFNGSTYGVTGDGKFVMLHESSGAMWGRSIVIGTPGSDRRMDCGLLSGDRRDFPRVSVRDFDFDMVLDRLRVSPSYVITLSGERAGRIEWSPGGPDGPGNSSEVREARIGFELNSRGLLLAYSMDSGVMSGTLTVPWEVLILRSPRFATMQLAEKTPGMS